jgi:hypothetical protein
VAAVGANIVSNKFDDIAREWTNLAEFLDDLKDSWPISAWPGSPDWDKFDLECEDTIAFSTKGTEKVTKRV